MAVDLARERAALDWFEGRRDEYLSALRRAQEGGAWSQVLELAMTFAPFLQRRSYWSEGEEVIGWGVEAAEELNDVSARAQLLDALGTIHRLQSRWDLAASEFETALELFAISDNILERARTLSNLALVERKRSKSESARLLLEESIALWERLAADDANESHLFGLARSVNNLGMVHRDFGEFEQARVLFEGALEIRRQIGDGDGTSRTLSNLGELQAAQGDLSQAERDLREALEMRRSLGDQHGVARAAGRLAAVLGRRGNTVEAAALLDEAMAIRESLGDRYGESQTLLQRARLMLDTGNIDQARTAAELATEVARSLNDARTVTEARAVLSEVDPPSRDEPAS